MNNIQILTNQDEVRDFMRKTLRTAIFQDSLNQESGYIARVVDKFGSVPRVIYDTDSTVEHSHFTTWFNAISTRPWYKDSGLHDLYWLHEMTHANLMLVPGFYQPYQPWAGWFARMAENEMMASLESEVFVYKELPGLRAQVFNHEIWADRLMSCAQSSNFQDIVINARKKVIQSPNPFDFVELQIANYAAQNLEWARVWATSRKEVETHMTLWMVKARGIYGDDLTANAVIGEHVRWLMSWRAPGSIPFEQEAYLFYRTYVENKDKYGNQFLERAR